MTDILWEYTYRVVPNIKDSNYESNAQRDVNQTGSSVR